MPDGRPLNTSARFFAGRRSRGGVEETIQPADYDALGDDLLHRAARIVEPGIDGQEPGGSLFASRDTGKPFEIVLRNDLATEDLPRVYAHELGHAIDHTAIPFKGIPQEASFDPVLNARLRDQYGRIYNDLNNPDASMRGVPVPPELRFNPGDLDYPADQWAQEFGAEALRAYMANPSYIKTIAPDVAARLRAYVNPHPELSKFIQLNSDIGKVSPIGAAVAGSPYPGDVVQAQDQEPGTYLKKHMDQPYQPQDGEDFQYRQDQADVQRLQDWVGRHLRHDLPPTQAEELMKRDPEYQRLYRKLWTPQPYNPEPGP